MHLLRGHWAGTVDVLMLRIVILWLWRRVCGGGGVGRGGVVAWWGVVGGWLEGGGGDGEGGVELVDYRCGVPG